LQRKRSDLHFRSQFGGDAAGIAGLVRRQQRPHDHGQPLALPRIAENNAGTLTLVAEEVIDGVVDLQIDYLIEGTSAYVAAGSVTDWNAVFGVRLQVVIEEPDKPSTARIECAAP
jgi:hypothetical protein